MEYAVKAETHQGKVTQARTSGAEQGLTLGAINKAVRNTSSRAVLVASNPNIFANAISLSPALPLCAPAWIAGMSPIGILGSRQQAVASPLFGGERTKNAQGELFRVWHFSTNSAGPVFGRS